MNSPSFTPPDLTNRALFADPYPLYQSLRSRSPVRYIGIPASEATGNAPVWSWGLLKYEDVYGALRDHQTFSSASPQAGQFGPKLVLIQDDPPRHTHFRRLVNRAFTLRRVEALEPWIAEIANALLDEMGEDGRDVVESYTVPLPVKVIARLLGIPGEDYVTFKRWSDAFLSTVSVQATERLQNLQEMVAYFGQMAAARRAHGVDDLISALVEADVEGEALQDWEILGFCILLLIAGNETTTNLLGNLLHALSARPDLWRRLREDRSLVETVIEESLRYESPVQRLFRWTTRDDRDFRRQDEQRRPRHDLLWRGKSRPAGFCRSRRVSA